MSAISSCMAGILSLSLAQVHSTWLSESTPGHQWDPNHHQSRGPSCFSSSSLTSTGLGRLQVLCEIERLQLGNLGRTGNMVIFVKVPESAQNLVRADYMKNVPHNTSSQMPRHQIPWMAALHPRPVQAQQSGKS